ncbi:MAG: hypothetical protein AABX17_00990 [Nanoarchaeota archaeon]
MKFDDHFLSWAFIYAIGAYLSIRILTYFNLSNTLFGLFIAGLIITILTFVMYAIIYERKFILDKWFFIWLFTHTFNFWWISLVLTKLSLTTTDFLYFLLFGLIYHIVTWIIKHKVYHRIRMNLIKSLGIMVVIVVLLLFVSSQPFSEISSTGLGENNIISSALNSLKGISSFSLFSGSCPQLNYPMQENNYGGKYLPDKNYDGWFVTSENYLNQLTNPLLQGFGLPNVNPYKISCSKGNQKGENPNYWYCGENYIQYASFEDNGYAVIIKPQKNSDGTIGDTIIKTFVNIYDEEGNFIKTTCGKAPDSLREDAFKGAMNELDDFFSLS